jgi:hypothetical protein
MDTKDNAKKKSPVILIILVLIVIVAFLVLDFRLLQGQADKSSQVSTYEIGVDKGSRLPMSQVLDVYVIGSSQLEDELAEALSNNLAGNLTASTIEVHEGAPVSSEESVLVVDLAQPDLLWTPFYSTAAIEMQVAYASDGKVDWIDVEPVIFNDPTPSVYVRGDYQMSDSAYGVMSMPGYKTYLAESLADQIASSLNERLANPNP